MRDEPKRDLSSAAEQIRAFVRGDAGVAVLKRLGLEVHEGPAVTITEPPGAPVYEAAVEDLARGFLANHARHDLKEWAGVILATGMVDLSRCEEHPGWDALLSAMWDASTGEPPNPSVIEMMKRLAR